MSVSSGFYNSINHDRKYDALQFGSIFDGIIVDGILMHYGNRFRVTPSSGMNLTVDTGRAWFNHTWTYNPSKLPVTIPPSELILNRIDAIVIDVDQTVAIRNNNIKVIKGVPATNAQRPNLIKTENHWQYPIAYVTVNKGATSLRQADITYMVGQAPCPYATCPLEKLDITDLVAQWQDQWTRFYEQETARWNKFYAEQTKEITDTNAQWKSQWQAYFTSISSAMREDYESFRLEWEAFMGEYTQDANETAEYWKRMWQEWFHNYTNNNTADMEDFREEQSKLFQEWFDGLQNTLSGDVAGNLLLKIEALEKRTEILERFEGDLENEFAIWYDIYDNHYDDLDYELQDSESDPVKDNLNDIIGSHEIVLDHEPILDAWGDPIKGRVLFCTKPCKC